MTYGPWGFIGLPYYHPDTFVVFLLFNVFYFLLCVFVVRQHWRKLVGVGLPPFVWFVVLLVVPAFSLAVRWGMVLFFPVILLNSLVLVHFLADGGWREPVKHLIFASLGPLVLMKAVFPLLVVATCTVIAADIAVRHRKWPFCLLTLAVSTILFWFLGGQGLNNVIPFLRGWAEISTGYREVMGYCPRSAPGPTLGPTLLFAVAAFCVWLKFLLAVWPRLRWRSWCPGAVLGMSLYIVFLHGFIRADATHIMVACFRLFAIAALIWPVLAVKRRSLRLWPRILVAVLVLSAAGVTLWHFPAGALLFRKATERFMETVSRPLLALMDSSESSSGRRRRHLDGLRTAAPLPAISGEVDVPAGDAGIAAANGLRFRPRPTLVSYSAYTPYLIRRNRDYLEGPRAPSAVLFAPPAIDGNYPTICDSLSFLTLATHYQLADIAPAGYLLFQKCSSRGTWRLEPLATRKLRLGEDVAVPPADGGPVWVTIEYQSTMWEWTLAKAFKSPVLYLCIIREGKPIIHRIFPRLAANGFLLLPYLPDISSFAAFYRSPAQLAPGLNQVRSFSIRRPGRDIPTGQGQYKPELTVKFYRLCLKADVDSAAPSRSAD